MTYSVLEGGNKGYWERTSSIDWCEENYIISNYIAEFYNTLSNLLFIALASAGVYRTIKNKVDIGYVLGYISVILVGIGSWLFHQTLVYEMQLMDELPMIFCAATMLYCCLEDGWFAKRFGKHLLLAGLLAFSCSSIVLYVVFNKPYIHQTAFGIMTASYALLMVPTVRGSPDYIINLIKVCVAAYATAFLLWNIDNLFCHSIRDFRQQISDFLSNVFSSLLPVWDGYSAAFVGSIATSFLQLHAWW
jgi:dihydroceramidase